MIWTRGRVHICFLFLGCCLLFDLVSVSKDDRDIYYVSNDVVMGESSMGTIKIEKNLGYSFADISLLNRALTRKAYALEQKQQNQDCKDQEVFRTLGDAVLKAVLVDLLIKSGCKTRDEITSKKKGLEREEKLAEVGKNLGIRSFIVLGVGEVKQKADKEPKVIAETLEALIGAIYLDRGYNASKGVITEWFESFFT